jgi:hypothetical protein
MLSKEKAALANEIKQGSFVCWATAVWRGALLPCMPDRCVPGYHFARKAKTVVSPPNTTKAAPPAVVIFTVLLMY